MRRTLRLAERAGPWRADRLRGWEISADFLLENPLFVWIKTQLLSELRFRLGRQAEVLAVRVVGTNMVTQRAQLLANGLPRLAKVNSSAFTARQIDVPKFYLCRL